MVETIAIFCDYCSLIINYLGNKSKLFGIVDMDAHVIRSDNSKQSATNAAVIRNNNGEESAPNKTALVIYDKDHDVASWDCNQDDELEEEVCNKFLALGPLKRPSSQSSDV